MVAIIPISLVATFTALSSVSSGTLPVAYMAGMSGLLYVDQRIRRERFDLHLAAIAQGAQR